MLKKVVVYSHDTFGLGNIRRMLTISQSMLSEIDNLSILMITGSPMIHSFSSTCSNLDYLKLPCLSRDLEGDYKARNIGFETDNLIQLRSQMIKAAVKQFNPDLMLIDKKPLGIQNELLRVLDYLYKRQSAKIVLLLRDILDSPDKTVKIWNKNNYNNLINYYYDRVLVAGSQDTFDVCKEYNLSNEVTEKVRFCGYINRSNVAIKNNGTAIDRVIKNKKLILVTPGGGEDGFKLIENYVKGLKYLNSDNYISMLITGPEMPINEKNKLKYLVKNNPNVIIKEFSDNLTELMSRSDLIISMAGYNTLCEILSLKKRAIVMPRVTPVKEQWIRASRFARKGLLEIIHPDEINPRNLMSLVQSQLHNQSDLDLKAFDFNGLSAINNEVRQLLFPPVPAGIDKHGIWQRKESKINFAAATDIALKTARFAS